MLNRKHKQRMYIIGGSLAGLALTAVLLFKAFSENMIFFYAPTQLATEQVPLDRNIRLGGLVADRSVRREDDGLTVHFDVTDRQETITVTYKGILPDLFREGQGIVALGRLQPDGGFAAEEVLAKHDENYMPPEVAEALQTANNRGEAPGDNPL